MDAMLASGAYPWTVIRTPDREIYLETLNTASIDGEFGPFADFLAERMRAMLEAANRPMPGSRRACKAHTIDEVYGSTPH
jgi:hypothetical protein